MGDDGAEVMEQTGSTLDARVEGSARRQDGNYLYVGAASATLSPGSLGLSRHKRGSVRQTTFQPHKLPKSAPSWISQVALSDAYATGDTNASAPRYITWCTEALLPE